MKIYLAGPMTGLPDHNYPAFHAAAASLRAAGDEVFNPAEHDDAGHVPGSATWAYYIRRDLPRLLCDVVVVLPGWQTSKGARLELHIAGQLGMPIIDHLSGQRLSARQALIKEFLQPPPEAV